MTIIFNSRSFILNVVPLIKYSNSANKNINFHDGIINFDQFLRKKKYCNICSYEIIYSFYIMIYIYTYVDNICILICYSHVKVLMISIKVVNKIILTLQSLRVAKLQSLQYKIKTFVLSSLNH